MSAVPLTPGLRQVLDLDLDEDRVLHLRDDRMVPVVLRSVQVQRDTVRGAIRGGVVGLLVEGRPIELPIGNYALPLRVGPLRLDCPLVREHAAINNAPIDLDAAARIRVWPAEGPLLAESTFTYPLRQRWFAASTQLGGEPVFTTSGWERPGLGQKTYHHFPDDLGGHADAIPVLAAVDGVVLGAAGRQATGVTGPAHSESRSDRVFLLDERRGWIIKHSHLAQIRVVPGQRVRQGQELGMLSTTGTSGGWGHLHFEILSPRADGTWMRESGYAYLAEAYLRERRPPLLAVARPHHCVRPGEMVHLDGSRSIAGTQVPVAWRWHLHEGGTADGVVSERRYDRPGLYSEVLEVTGDGGARSWDFAAVCVVVENHEHPGLNAAFAPVDGLRPGDAVVFQWRIARPAGSNRVRWDFGDGSPAVVAPSRPSPSEQDAYPNRIEHRYQRPGSFIVRLDWAEDDRVAMYHLLVEVAP